MARKYITYMHIGLQDALVYRANAIIWMLVDSLPAYTMLLIWSAVYQGRQSIAGYTLGDMAAYYLAATFIGVAIEAHPEYSLSYEIRHGLLSHQLVRPWSYFWASIVGETSWQVVKSAMGLPLLALIAWVFRSIVSWPQLRGGQWAVFLLSVVLAFAINIGAKMALGSLAFWLAEPMGILNIYDSLSWLLQGGVVPIDLFPRWLQIVGDALPFKYSLAFPVMILLNRLPAQALIPGLLWQAFWALCMMGTALGVWRRGVRAYAAVGG